MGWMPALLLAGCGQPAAPSVDGGWVRLAAVPGRPAAAYFTLHGGTRATTLVAVRAALARRGELHQSMNAGGMASMKPLARVAVPAGARVIFAPGGRHVMLFDVDPGAAAGGTTTLTLVFADGRTVATSAQVRAAGDPAPGD